MERKLVLLVTTASLLAVALALLLPGGRVPDEFPKLPWQISLDENGDSSVLGVTLGKTTLGEVQEAYGAEAKINLFASSEQEYAVEAYFERLFLSGIKADLIFALDLSQPEAEHMYQRGLRVSKLGSGARKVDLAPQDRQTLLGKPVSHITYLPAADLEPELLSNLFGEPSRRITAKTGITHWLYPEKGLDIALNPDGKEIFQYISPGRFSQLLAPLEHSQSQHRPGSERNREYSKK